MTHTRVFALLQWVGWVLIAVLCVLMGLLWSRMEHQVARNAADIVAMKAYSDTKDARLRDEATSEQSRLERRWGTFLMPTLRQHHEALQVLDPTVVPPMPDWLKEKP